MYHAGVTDHNRMRRDIKINKGSRSDHYIVAYGHMSYYDRIGTDPDFIAYNRRSLFEPLFTAPMVIPVERFTFFPIFASGLTIRRP